MKKENAICKNVDLDTYRLGIYTLTTQFRIFVLTKNMEGKIQKV